MNWVLYFKVKKPQHHPVLGYSMVLRPGKDFSPVSKKLQVCTCSPPLIKNLAGDRSSLKIRPLRETLHLLHTSLKAEFSIILLLLFQKPT